MKQTIDLFRTDNTEGYSQTELDKLNNEWKSIIDKMKLDEFTDEYDIQSKSFCDIVAKR